MARGGFIAAMNRAAREAERAARSHARELEREARYQEKIARQSYLEERQNDVEEANLELNRLLSGLSGILKDGLSRNPRFDLRSLYRKAEEKELDLESALKLPPRPKEQDYLPRVPNQLLRLIPGVMPRYEAKLASTRVTFATAEKAFADVVTRRASAFAALQAEVAAHNRNIDSEVAALEAGEPDAVVNYYDIVFARSPYPEGFPQEYRIAYVRESKQLVVEVQLPALDVVPTVERYRYVKSSDEIAEVKKSEKARQSIYADAISQSALRHPYEVFAADPCQLVDVTVLNCFVSTIDPSTGHRINPCIISIRTSRDDFNGLELKNVDPTACLKRMHAVVSRSPSELIAVKPIIDFNMVDPRFIKEEDVLSKLDNRPNLMELTPSEFESLITNLFQKMGLDTKLTQASRDGGVDCVAYDPRPVLGGKVIVQAKRYKNTVGVSAVRDLFGTVHNEGAAKGILVTTSGFGKAAYDFANGKPLELITGSNLLYMLKEYCGTDAKIVMPDDWTDPDRPQ